MKIVARLTGENPGLVKELTEKGINAKLVRGETIVTLPLAEKENWSDPDVYVIPVGVESARLMIDTAESGGGMTNTGAGTIVCGLDGEALRPYYIPKGYSNGEHAYFSGQALIQITGYRRDSNVDIVEYRISRTGNTATLIEKKVWSGELEFLPDTFAKFQEAAQAASKKGGCYHCRCVHYAA